MKKEISDICQDYNHVDCFARLPRGMCRILADTDFGDRKCPFYKSCSQFEEEKRSMTGDVTRGRKLK